MIENFEFGSLTGQWAQQRSDGQIKLIEMEISRRINGK